MRPPSAVVVGAGLAGLTAAYRLRQAGWHVTVLEVDDRIGGRVATIHKNGFVIDTGATQISSGYKEYLELCRSVRLTDHIRDSSQYIGVLRKRRIHLLRGDNPLSLAMSGLLSIRGKWTLLKCLRDYLSLDPPVDPLDVSAASIYDTESALSYCRRRLSDEVYEALVDPLLRAYVMNRGSNVSRLEWFSSLSNLAGRRMISLDGGNSRLPMALGAHFPVRLRTAVLRVRAKDDGVTIYCRDEGGEEDSIEADACVIATRLPEAVAIYPTFRVVTGTLADDLHYNRGLVVHLGYERRPMCPAIGLLLAAHEHPAIGLIWLEHNKNPDRVPGTQSLFSVYFDEAVNDQLFDRDSSELIRLAASFIEQLFPSLREGAVVAHVTRWPLAIPNPSPGIYRAVHAMKTRLNPAASIQYAGDYFTCVGQNSAIHYGRLAAENLIRFRGVS